jgi:hypothetical protein
MGIFAITGEVHEGKHKAIIDKRLFDKVQAVIDGAWHKTKGKNRPANLLWIAALWLVRHGYYCRKESKAPKER